jgi:hypothetical protein
MSDHRLAERTVGFLVAYLSGDGDAEASSRLRRRLRALAEDLIEDYSLPPFDATPPATLADASDELLDRCQRAGVGIMQPFGAEAEKIVLEGLPFSLDEIIEEAARSANEFLPMANGRPRLHVATMFGACGVIKGAIAAKWQR